MRKDHIKQTKKGRPKLAARIPQIEAAANTKNTKNTAKAMFSSIDKFLSIICKLALISFD